MLVFLLASVMKPTFCRAAAYLILRSAMIPFLNKKQFN